MTTSDSTPSSSTAPTDQLNVARPFAAPASQRDEHRPVLTEAEIVDLAIQCGMSDADYEDDPAGYCYNFARAIEAELASRCRAQGGVTNSKPNSTAPTVEVDELLGRYWEIAYSEGATGESRGSEAQEVLSSIRATFRAALASRPPAEATGEISHDVAARQQG